MKRVQATIAAIAITGFLIGVMLLIGLEAMANV